MTLSKYLFLSFIFAFSLNAETTPEFEKKIDKPANGDILQEKEEIEIQGQPPLEDGGLPKDYYDIKSTSKVKKYFFNYIYNLVEKENINILKERAIVKEFANQSILNFNFSSSNFRKYQKIQKKYKVDSFLDTKKLLKRVDIIPPSQALAQAAVESGWGKSRFIKEANNIFGHWTYTPDIGLMPLKRDEDATHFIRIFPTLQASVNAYMYNLNKNPAYEEFQEKRYNLRKEKKQLSGKVLSQTMLKYSGIGHNYLEILDDVISKNDLEQFDYKFFNKINKGIK